ncbi:relaxase/mobilization nuclease domain-containing protein [Listeria kieliensis]|uniref:MobA/VirD2-like nuclease domain-containing protein n=1 Tax=Listeria kieliensis TaxID=1621700 RepID=A0A3D8TQE2_9LIST|nr:relaxase/mobilization nuclease domain-containing protein [Listeria kieliensis]RDX00873.1 hypothetical protein UR08_07855 [Listeria kieliensis]
MAWTEIHPIKSTLRKALDYICNPEKTDGKLLISSFGCDPETADIEFQFTLDQSVGKKGNNLAHHLIQSFDYGETTPEEAHRIGQELCDRLLGGKYEYVLTTHIDKGHVHNHIMFCAANFVDRHKYVSNNKTRFGIRKLSDQLCREHGLSVIKAQHWKTPNLGQKYGGKEGQSKKAKLAKAIDHYITISRDFEDMLQRMERDGYEIKRAKYISYKPPGEGRFMGGVTLGAEYTDERVSERIAGLAKAPQKKRPVQLHDDNRINLITDIENNVKAQASRGYKQAVQIENLKRMARTVNFLTENNLLQYEQLQAKISEIQTLFDDTTAELKAVEGRLSDMALLIKNVENFRRTYPAYKNYKQARNKQKAYEENESAILIHTAAKKALADMGITGKLPSVAELKEQYAEMEKEKAALYKQYNGHKVQVKEYGTVKANIDEILGRRPEQEKEQEKSKKQI